METKIIEGRFSNQKTRIYIGTTVSIVCFLIGVILSIWLENAIMLFCMLPFIAIYTYLVCLCLTLRKQKLLVTNYRVIGVIQGKEINLPLDKISHIDLQGKKSYTLSIATASGIIRCAGCINGNDIYLSLAELLRDRTIHSMNHSNTSQEVDSSQDVATELKKYKKLLDEQLITAEDYDAIKKRLLKF